MFKIGEKVKFISSSQEQVNWGSNTNPDGILNTDTTYEISYVEVHSWHTKIELVGIKGQFNSVSFDYVPIKEIRKEKLNKINDNRTTNRMDL
jgi:hypothetical protein